MSSKFDRQMNIDFAKLFKTILLFDYNRKLLKLTNTG